MINSQEIDIAVGQCSCCDCSDVEGHQESHDNLSSIDHDQREQRRWELYRDALKAQGTSSYWSDVECKVALMGADTALSVYYNTKVQDE